MTNQEIALILVHISEILGIQGENPFKIRAYIKGAQTIEGLTYQLSSLEGRSGIGELPHPPTASPVAPSAVYQSSYPA